MHAIKATLQRLPIWLLFTKIVLVVGMVHVVFIGYVLSMAFLAGEPVDAILVVYRRVILGGILPAANVVIGESVAPKDSWWTYRFVIVFLSLGGMALHPPLLIAYVVIGTIVFAHYVIQMLRKKAHAVCSLYPSSRMDQPQLHHP